MSKLNPFVELQISTIIDKAAQTISTFAKCEQTDTLRDSLRNNYNGRVIFNNRVAKKSLQFSANTPATSPNTADRELIITNSEFNSIFSTIAISTDFYIAICVGDLDPIVLSSITHCGTRQGKLIGLDLEGNTVTDITVFVAVSELKF